MIIPSYELEINWPNISMGRKTIVLLISCLFCFPWSKQKRKFLSCFVSIHQAYAKMWKNVLLKIIQLAKNGTCEFICLLAMVNVSLSTLYGCLPGILKENICFCCELLVILLMWIFSKTFNYFTPLVMSQLPC